MAPPDPDLAIERELHVVRVHTERLCAEPVEVLYLVELEHAEGFPVNLQDRVELTIYAIRTGIVGVHERP